MKKEMNEKAEPFFARYLEGQDFPRVKTNVKAGATTLKFPSDLDDHQDVTQKYPSDSDEGVDS